MVVVLPLPAGPGQDDRAGGLVQAAPEAVAHLAGRPRSSSRRNRPGAGEHPHDGLLAEDGREGGEPHLDLARRAADPPFLRDVGPIGQQLGHHLEPGDDVRRDPDRHRTRPAGARRRSASAPPGRRRPAASGRRWHPGLCASASTRSTTSVAYRGSAGSSFARASDSFSADMMDHIPGRCIRICRREDLAGHSDCTVVSPCGSRTRMTFLPGATGCGHGL